jgi:prepilin-type N-terminal cleavage/methylation domain-containing protein
MKPMCRRGYTLIEVLVVAAIISILIGLMLPAIESAREAARNARCRNNLHQIGLALTAYHDTNGLFPPALMGYNQDTRPIYFGYHSWISRTLPYLDQKPLYDSINFDLSTFPLETLGWSQLKPWESALNAANQTAYYARLSVLICPSDSPPAGAPGNSYRGNTGVGPDFDPSAEHPDSGNGLFAEMCLVRMSNIPDGLSFTAAVSERLIGSSGSGGMHAERDPFAKEGMALNADDLLITCRIAARKDIRRFIHSGRWWFWTGRERTLYTHTQVPNGIVPDCIQGGLRPAAGMITARSWHSGGVCTLMADGSVRFISESVTQHAWRALGTRNGSEIVE